MVSDSQLIFNNLDISAHLLKIKTELSNLEKYSDPNRSAFGWNYLLGKNPQASHTFIWAVYPTLPGRSSQALSQAIRSDGKHL